MKQVRLRFLAVNIRYELLSERITTNTTCLWPHDIDTKVYCQQANSCFQRRAAHDKNVVNLNCLSLVLIPRFHRSKKCAVVNSICAMTIHRQEFAWPPSRQSPYRFIRVHLTLQIVFQTRLPHARHTSSSISPRIYRTLIALSVIASLFVMF